MKRKNVINNKSLNLLLKNQSNSSKTKSVINDIKYDDILFQSKNTNGNYKSIYFFKDEIYDKENYLDNLINIKHFSFKDFNDEINIINERKKPKDDINKISQSDSINKELELKKENYDKKIQNNKIKENIIQDVNKKIDDNNVNNSYKIINESKFNNRSKVTIYLINDNKN
jgi:hypothetical protein